MGKVTWPEFFISASVTTLLHSLLYNQAPSGKTYFPKGSLKDECLRVGKKETLHSWFMRCSKAAGSYKDIQFAKNIAIVGTEEWESNSIHTLSVQALAFPISSLADYHSGTAEEEPHYFRLDLNINQPGQLFCEPQPHLHTRPNGSPRVAFKCESARTLILDFIEFLFLNYAYDEWMDWVRQIWERDTFYETGQDPFDRFLITYPNPQTTSLITKYSDDLKKLRRLLTAEKIRLASSMHPISDDTHKLNYSSNLIASQ